jgi:hypothetical protein
VLLANTVADLHQQWAWVVVIGNGLAGVWVLASVRLERLGSRAMWWFVVAAQLSIFVEVGLGVWMVAAQDIEGDDFHMFYGFVALITVGILYSYRSQLSGRIQLLYGLGGLFLMGLGIRAMLLGN